MPANTTQQPTNRLRYLRNKSFNNSLAPLKLASSMPKRTFSDNDLNGLDQEASATTSIDKNMLFSRYHTDFTEIEKLASGGFGSVYRARNIIDDNEYAIKKIYFKNSTPDFCEKVLRETRVFSSLNHENIVNYHSSWLEFDVVSTTTNKQVGLESHEKSRLESKSGFHIGKYKLEDLKIDNF